MDDDDWSLMFCDWSRVGERNRWDFPWSGVFIVTGWSRVLWSLWVGEGGTAAAPWYRCTCLSFLPCSGSRRWVGTGDWMARLEVDEYCALVVSIDVIVRAVDWIRGNKRLVVMRGEREGIEGDESRQRWNIYLYAHNEISRANKMTWPCKKTGKYPAAQIWQRAFGILYDDNGMWVSCEINWLAQATSMQFYNDYIIHVHQKKSW